MGSKILNIIKKIEDGILFLFLAVILLASTPYSTIGILGGMIAPSEPLEANKHVVHGVS